MKRRSVIVEDHGLPLIWLDEDVSRLPKIAAADLKALFWLICFLVIFVAITVVEAPQ